MNEFINKRSKKNESFRRKRRHNCLLISYFLHPIQTLLTSSNPLLLPIIHSLYIIQYWNDQFELLRCLYHELILRNKLYIYHRILFYLAFLQDKPSKNSSVRYIFFRNTYIYILPFTPKSDQSVTYCQNVDFRIRRDCGKIFLWAPCLWVGRRKKPLLD